MNTNKTRLANARRLVVKVGSALVTNNGAGLDLAAIDDWARQISALRAQGKEVVLVSSGAIAAGRSELGLTDRPRTIPQKQAAAAIGQAELISAYQPLAPTQETLYWRWTQQANRRLLLEMLAEGKLEVEKLITHRVPAAQAPEFYERLKKGNAGMLGVMLNW